MTDPRIKKIREILARAQLYADTERREALKETIVATKTEYLCHYTFNHMFGHADIDRFTAAELGEAIKYLNAVACMLFDAENSEDVKGQSRSD